MVGSGRMDLLDHRRGRFCTELYFGRFRMFPPHLKPTPPKLFVRHTVLFQGIDSRVRSIILALRLD